MKQQRSLRTKVGVALIVLLVLSVIVVMSLPTLSTPPEAVHRREDKNNLKDIGIALHDAQDGVGGRVVADPDRILPPFLTGRKPVKVDFEELAEHPERYRGENRPWWLVESPAPESLAKTK